MITKEDRQIIEAEISRLERAYREAQDRYAYSGSSSTERTMYKYQTLQNALENYLTGNADASKEKMIIRQQDQLRRALNTTGDLFRSGDMSEKAFLALTAILKEV